MDKEAQGARTQALLQQLSPAQLEAIQHVVRQQLLAELHGEVDAAWEARREQCDAQLITVTRERDEARNGRALAEQLLVSLLRQLLPGQEPVYLFGLGVRELDAYSVNQVLAKYHLRLCSRRSASERQVNTRVGERHWERRSLFWLEPLLAGEGAVPELERAAPDDPSGRGEGASHGGGPAEAG
jgi:hypothetical protein